MIHATVFAKDFDRLVAFYQLFGFAPQTVEPKDFATLSDGDAELTIVQIPERYSRDIVIETPPVVRSTTPIKLTFIVVSRRCLPAATRWNGGGWTHHDWQAFSWHAPNRRRTGRETAIRTAEGASK